MKRTRNIHRYQSETNNEAKSELQPSSPLRIWQKPRKSIFPSNLQITITNARIITRTNGIAWTAQLFFDPKDFTMIFSRNCQDIPSKMISITGQGKGSTVSHGGTDNTVGAEDLA
ncbi:hypothetical protein I3843_01G255100 [Carya illinoinensis]|nr:hypothetical protein I3843_01G255100 [Carya illinoinensis]